VPRDDALIALATLLFNPQLVAYNLLRATMPINKLILGDNLKILKQMESESVDLVYLVFLMAAWPIPKFKL
jgi:hypothetical protein